MSAVEKVQETQRSQANDRNTPEDIQTKSTASKSSKKVLDYYLQLSRKHQHKQPDTEEKGTVFTDRDFDKFEQEYDFFDS